MALFMDMHSIEGGVSASDAAAAHQADLATQAGYGVNYLRYWVDEEAGKIFCLVDAPDGTWQRPQRQSCTRPRWGRCHEARSTPPAATPFALRR